MTPILNCLTLAAAAVISSHALAQKQTPLERGRYLVEGIVACGNCHMARGARGDMLPAQGLSGGMLFDEPPFRAVASNITPDADTGIGKWSDAQLITAMREGLRPDGSVIGPPMPVEFYRHMSDSDAAAIVAYLRAQPTVRKAVGKSVYNMPLPKSYGPALGQVATPPSSDKLRYGKYLANLGHCMECHTPRGADGQLQWQFLGVGGHVFAGPWGQSVARNLTPHTSGLKDWTDAQITTATRDGMDRNGQPYRPPMGFAFYKNIGDSDMAALVAYLRTLKPLATGGKP